MFDGWIRSKSTESRSGGQLQSSWRTVHSLTLMRPFKTLLHKLLRGSSFSPKSGLNAKTSLFYGYFWRWWRGAEKANIRWVTFESARQQRRYFHSSREAERAGFVFWEELRGGGCSVGLVGGEQGSIHRLHAGGAGEGPHEPVVYTVHVVDVHTRQEPDGVAVYEVQHADHALSDLLLRAVWAPVEDPFGQMLNEADALSDADLLLLRELRGQTGLTGRGVVQRHVSRLLIWRWWL